ncbi:hypothetical protein BS78_02G014300 [Paspalum vaginatum]|nr:hypothetical protein BS78_02G014300 [Paspalum vaginatum]
MAVAAPPPLPLPEELVEEILVRFPPDEPANLVRAALVCKLWRRIVSGAAFRRAFREFHRAAAPVTGPTTRFVPTSFFCPARAVHRSCCVIDARHGRVLLHREPPASHTSSIDLSVWDPDSDEQRHLPGLPWDHMDMAPFPYEWNAAVMCRCCRDHHHHHHLGCASSSFLVVVIEIKNQKMTTYIYASESGAWTEAASSTTYHGDLKLQEDYWLQGSGVLVANVLHFMVSQSIATLSIGVIRYHLATHQISAIRLQLPRLAYNSDLVLVAMEGGQLGLAAMHKAKLCMYWPTTRDSDSARQIELGSDSGDRGAILFVLGRVIDLEKLQKPVISRYPSYPYLIHFNFADAIGILFIRTHDGGLYSVHIKSGHVKRLPGCYKHCDHVVPYVSFHTPRN